MLQDESKKPDEEARDEPDDRATREGETSEGRLKAVNIVQQNAVIITGRREKGGRSKPEKPNSDRWL